MTVSFYDYFNVADEIYESLRAGADQAVPTEGIEPLTLADLDPKFVKSANDAAAKHNLPWPAHLPTAEEFLLRNPGVQ